MADTQPADFRRWLDLATGRLARHVTQSIDIAGRGLKADIRSVMRAAGLGNRLPNAVRQTTYPNPLTKGSLEAASVVKPAGKSAKRIMDAFADGAVIRSKHGKYLAIPLPAVPRNPGRKGGKMSPVEVEARFNVELRFVPRRGRPPLLVLDKAVGARSRTKRRSFGAADAAARSRQTVPMFVLMPAVKLRKRFDLKSLHEKWQRVASTLIAAGPRPG